MHEVLPNNLAKTDNFQWESLAWEKFDKLTIFKHLANESLLN